MAKHAHRLMLNQKKTWRCTLPNCRYFIHIGLAHVLPGQQSICWECASEFTLDEQALTEDQPRCSNCRSGEEKLNPQEQKDYDDALELMLAMKKLGLTNTSQLNDAQKTILSFKQILRPATEERVNYALNPDNKD